MIEIVATIDKDANPSFIRKIFESIRGVVKTSVKTKIEKPSSPTTKFSLNDGHGHMEELSEEKKKWLDELDALCNDVDRSVIDPKDERTRYLLSK